MRHDQAAASSDTTDNDRGTCGSHGDDASHPTERLPASKHIERDTSQRDAQSKPASLAPAGTIGEAVVEIWLLQGPIFSEWSVLHCMTLTCNDLHISNTHPDVSLDF